MWDWREGGRNFSSSRTMAGSKDGSRTGGEDEPGKGGEKEKDKDEKPQESEPVLPEESPELLPPRLPGAKGFSTPGGLRGCSTLSVITAVSSDPRPCKARQR